jgi:hypothetical protein
MYLPLRKKIMTSKLPFLLHVLLLLPLLTIGQKVTLIDEHNTTPIGCKAIFHGDSVHIVNESQSTSILWLNGINIKNGSIDLDLKGSDVRGESFLGVAFHGQNDSTYCAIYFRPFNFRSPEKSNHAVQFVDHPGSEWDLLRDKFPGVYENSINPAPNPNGWFHARIVIDFPMIKVFVNDAPLPCLTVRQISDWRRGSVGVWVDSKDGWFKDVAIHSNTDEH